MTAVGISGMGANISRPYSCAKNFLIMSDVLYSSSPIYGI